MNTRPGTSATLVRLVGVATAIVLAIGDGSSRSHLSAQNADAIGPAALAQIAALLNEKAARSRSEQKLDSQLLYGLRMSRGQAIASGVPTIEVNLRSEPDNQLVLDVSGERGDQLAAQLLALGVQIIHADPRDGAVRVRARLDQVEAIAALPAVTFVQPKQEAVTLGRVGSSDRRPLLSDDRGSMSRFRTRNRAALLTSLRRALPLTDAVTSVGSRNSEGDLTHRASTVRATFGVNGTGVKIGVLSDGVTNLASSQASGDLGAVTVLPGQAGTGDEGTAMLEIIHDLAPGAQLYFATAFTSITSFAQNIRDLRAAGCDIIVDDVFYFVETPFQDGQTSSVISTRNGGVVIQAVKDVTASGALYFSSAGNGGNKNDNTSGTWEGDFVDGGPTTTPLPVGNLHAFVLGTTFNTLTTSASPINLHWSDPLGGSANDYDLFLLNSTGTSVLASSTNIQNGTQDPYEQMSGGSSGARIVIVKKTNAAARFLHLDTNRGQLSISTAGQTHGHAATSAANSFGVSATPAATRFCGTCPVGPYPNPFNSTNVVENFSSDGPRRIFFNGNGTAITPGNVSSTGGQVLSKPDLTAADGVSVTGVGGFPSTFFGTSAAAPHAGAIAALVKSVIPSLTAAQIRVALVSTAIDIETAGPDRDAGAGIVDAFAAVQSVLLANPPTVVTGAASAVSATGATLNGTADPNGSATTAFFQWGLTTAYGNATPGQSLGSGNGAVAIGGGAITGLACGMTYHFRATATNAGGTANGADATLTTSGCSSPTVVTGVASAVSATGATLNGTANPNGSATTGFFQWGLTTAYGNTTPGQNLGSGNGTVAIGGGAITGLACGTTYHFRATATNAGGTTNGADATLTTTVCSSPTVVTGAASAVSATGATLNGTANPNGSSTTGFFQWGVTTAYGNTTPGQNLGSGNGAVAIGGGAITGLACGTTYHFRATATNAGGTTNGADATLTAVCSPGAPTGVGALAGNTQATVSFTAPVSNGGAAISSYTVTASPGGATASGPGSPLTVTGLTNGTPYTFTVVATNSVGSSVPSSPSNSVTPATVPGPPTNVSAVGGNAQATVSFTAPASNGGAAITSYTVTASPGGATASGPGSPLTLTGLSNGTAYTFTVVATNSVGSSAPSSPSDAARPATAVPVPNVVGLTQAAATAAITSAGLVVGTVSSASSQTVPPESVISQTPASGTQVKGSAVHLVISSGLPLVVFRPSIGGWFIGNASQAIAIAPAQFFQWGLPGDVPIAADFDGDGKLELSVFRPATGEWFIRYSAQNYDASRPGVFQWGLPGDVPIASDFDGDGKSELAVYRPSIGGWFIRYSSEGYSTATATFYQWGLPGDVPIAADFDGDGKTDLTVFRPATGEWFIRYSAQRYEASTAGVYQWGLPGDVPLVGDFDGDGKTELAVFRPLTAEWFIRDSSQSYSIAMARVFQWGLSGDVAIAADFDADGKTELTVFRPATGEWFLRYSAQRYDASTAGVYQWGLPGDVPIKP